MRIFTLFISVSLCFASCKKQLQPGNPVSTFESAIVSSMQQYLRSSHAEAGSQTFYIEGKSMQVSQEFAWDKLIADAQYKTNIVPVKLTRAPDFPLQRYYICYKNDSGVISGGFYADLYISPGSRAVFSGQELLDMFSARHIPADFNGAMAWYSIFGSPVETWYYTNGTSKDFRLNLEPRVNQSPGYISPEDNGSCVEVTVDWYWQTYDEQGNLVAEDYIYSTQELLCGGMGGGGGQGGETPTPEEILNLIFSNGHISSDAMSSPVIFETPTLRKLRLSWLIYYNAQFLPYGIGSYSYSFVSHETGTQVKGSDNRWHWESIVHNSVTRSGWGIAVTMQCENVSAAGNITVSGTHESASMDLSFQIHSGLLFKGFPIEEDMTYSTSRSWQVQQSGIPEQPL